MVSGWLMQAWAAGGGGHESSLRLSSAHFRRDQRLLRALFSAASFRLMFHC
jgi:hypothetical protein